MKRRDSEVEAYKFVLDKLDELGWDTRNPERHPDGEVYTQNQALEHNELKRQLGQDHPENLVKISESKYWVIETKNKQCKLDQAVNEAINQYADQINQSSTIEAALISGIAGNDADKYKIENKYLEDGDPKLVMINEEETTNLLSPEIVERILDTESATLRDIPIDEDYFLSKAEKINQILHEGAINKNRRAKVIAALLLAIADSDPRLDNSPKVLIRDINTRVENALEREGKLGFKNQIQIDLPSAPENHQKFKTAIVRTIRELKDLNIRSAMNSSNDVLGKFYEVFLKYGNGAKDIGIVLTPRHVTEFAAEILDIGHKDIVYDPTCGTGGFLVAALDKVRRESNKKQVGKFKENRLFGIEQEPEVIALAVVNMIFRGDGKNNIIGGNCFYQRLTAANKNGVSSAKYIDTDTDNDPPVTKILMNPPFGLEDEDEQSYKFIEHVLDDMEDGGILFSVVNYSALVKQNQSKQWREDLLDNHTVLSVMTFPNDLFYPVGVETAGIVIKKGESHPDDQDVLWARPVRDGRLKSKGKRLPHPDEPNQFEGLETITKAFISSPSIKVEDEDRFITTEEINSDDSSLELVPEEYIPATEPTQSEFIEQIDRFLEQLIGNLMLYIDDFDSTIFRASLDKNGQKQAPDESEITYEEFDIPTLFDVESGEYHVATEPSEGPYPLISCSTDRNGIVKSRGDLIYCDVPDEHLYRDALTVAYNGQPLTARFHPYTFTAKDDAAVLTAKDDYDLSPAAKIYIANAIEQNKWRYGYGRKCYKGKMQERRIKLPKKDGELAIEYMEQIIIHSPYWQVLEQYMKDREEPESDEYEDSGKSDSSQTEESMAEIEDYLKD